MSEQILTITDQEKYRGRFQSSCDIGAVIDAIERREELAQEKGNWKLRTNRRRNIFELSIKTNGSNHRVNVKAYAIDNILHLIAYAFRRSYAMRSWRTAVQLGREHIGTPEPLAVVEERTGSRRRESFYVSRTVEGVSDLAVLLVNQLLQDDESTQRKRRQLLRAVAEMVRKFHTVGLYHADMRANNILVKWDDGDAPHFYLIDLDRSKYWPWLLTCFQDYFRILDLRKLDRSLRNQVSERERMTFFALYSRGLIRGRRRKRWFVNLINRL